MRQAWCLGGRGGLSNPGERSRAPLSAALLLSPASLVSQEERRLESRDSGDAGPRREQRARTQQGGIVVVEYNNNGVSIPVPRAVIQSVCEIQETRRVDEKMKTS